MVEREFLLDVSRLIWRIWTGRLPTGIDRVCIAYLEHFGARSQAVVQRKGYHRILSARHSDALFQLLLHGRDGFRMRLARLLPQAMAQGHSRLDCRGCFYLNVGHTGLDEPSLPDWIAGNNLRAIHLIHDLIPISHPEFCRPGEAQRHRERMTNALRSAAGIIGNSLATLGELDAFAREAQLPAPPQLAAWISGNDVLLQAHGETPRQPYFVVVGTIEGRKNHVILLQVWRRLIANLGAAAPHLYIVGQRGWEAENAVAMLDRCAPLKNHVHELARCGDEELARLMAGARALLMPSFAEGFGLPLVEALQAGTPAIASNLAVFREIAGDIPTFLDPIDGKGWEHMIGSFLEDGPERRRQLQLLPDYRAPTWPGHFAAVERWIAQLQPAG